MMMAVMSIEMIKDDYDDDDDDSGYG